MKKIISVLLCLTMLLTLSTAAFAGNGEAIITADNIAVYSGDTAAVSVYLDADVASDYSVTNGKIYLWFDVEFNNQYADLKTFALSQEVKDMGGYSTTLDRDDTNGITSVIACVVIPDLSILSKKTDLIDLDIAVSSNWDKRDIALLCNCSEDLGNESYIYSNGQKTTVQLISGTGSVYLKTEDKTVEQLIKEKFAYLWQVIKDYVAILINYLKSL